MADSVCPGRQRMRTPRVSFLWWFKWNCHRFGDWFRIRRHRVAAIPQGNLSGGWLLIWGRFVFRYSDW